MSLLQIDFSFLPGLHMLARLFGSFADIVMMPGSDDTIAVLIAFLYELDPTRGLI